MLAYSCTQVCLYSSFIETTSVHTKTVGLHRTINKQHIIDNNHIRVIVFAKGSDHFTLAIMASWFYQSMLENGYLTTKNIQSTLAQ